MPAGIHSCRPYRGYRLCLRQNKGYGLVIIDGIRDLMLDINSTSESVEVINKMMEWSSKYDLHIHCVLHLNKGDNNVRGISVRK
mgnify:FL=1